MWTDPSRRENPDSDSRSPRHIVAYVYYPALAEGRAAEYYPDLKQVTSGAGNKALAAEFGDAWRLVETDGVTTNSYENALLPAGRDTYPVLLFSPGMGFPAVAYSTQLENLASNGYVAIALEHPYSTAVVALPDRTVAVAPSDPDSGPPNLQGIKRDLARQDVWVADTQFVLMHIGELESQRSQFKSRLDLQRIGIFGHSLGGRVAVRLCQTETNISGCLNEDGGLFNADAQTLTVVPAVDADKSTNAPLFNIDVKFTIPPIPDEKVRAQIAQWQQKKADALALFLKKNKPATYAVSVDTLGFSHLSFTDIPYLDAAAAGKDGREAGTNLASVNEFTVAFFDSVLNTKSERMNALLTHLPEGVTVREFGSTRKQ